MIAFERFRSSSGEWSARQRAGGVLVHSAHDPRAEAMSIAQALCRHSVSTVWIIGDGLGYLHQALNQFNRVACIIEPFPELRHLTGDALMEPEQTETRKALADLLLQMQERNVTVYVAPYVRSLVDELPRDIASIINEIAVLSNSREEYATLIRTNISMKRKLLESTELLRAPAMRQIAIACGSGPSLLDSMQALCCARDAFSLIACSSSVPTLLEHEVVPDWTIALEAHRGVARDLDLLHSGARVVVFEWTDPEVFQLRGLDLYLSDNQGMPIETGGGTTLLTAADLASRIASREIYLVGADMSWAHGFSADDSAVWASSSERRVAPKFAVMRNKFEKWIRNQQGKTISHVVGNRALLLEGAQHILPQQLASVLTKHSECVNL